MRLISTMSWVSSVLGIGWMYAPTQWPLVGPLVDKLYDIWADWRLRLTGRPDLATVIAQRNQRCQDQACRL